MGDIALIEHLTRCCGRKECGGECGNEWRGMMSIAPVELPLQSDEVRFMWLSDNPEHPSYPYWDAELKKWVVVVLAGSHTNVSGACDMQFDSLALAVDFAISTR